MDTITLTDPRHDALITQYFKRSIDGITIESAIEAARLIYPNCSMVIHVGGDLSPYLRISDLATEKELHVPNVDTHVFPGVYALDRSIRCLISRAGAKSLPKGFYRAALGKMSSRERLSAVESLERIYQFGKTRLAHAEPYIFLAEHQDLARAYLRNRA